MEDAEDIFLLFWGTVAMTLCDHFNRLERIRNEWQERSGGTTAPNWTLMLSSLAEVWLEWRQQFIWLAMDNA